MGLHFPKWLQTQKQIKYLDISDAGISDILPSWFWSLCRNVEFMNLTGNQIRGSFANLTLEFSYSSELHLSSNKLEGLIPSVLSTASYLDLSHKKLSGSISFLCSSAAIGLSFLDLSSNNVFGEVPDCLTHLENLVVLDLSYIALSGKIPTTIGSLFHIETLKLRSNKFVGQLPSSLKNCTNLVLVDVGDNKLSGPIAKWLGVSLKNLVILMLSSNHFNGSLPAQICHLTDIHILDFSMNNISGSRPGHGSGRVKFWPTRKPNRRGARFSGRVGYRVKSEKWAEPKMGSVRGSGQLSLGLGLSPFLQFSKSPNLIYLGPKKAQIIFF
ncbi:hypothetical protein L3X38_013507 [Prunus dulcis]|uniref:Disease resistance family protein / LRR family protein n=1 Tax=Prunus dulcis TaxID=3755 RepID=A0AAD4WLG4_PRUDU|nr:hypothetical protein L3X38_013507 [Prunus dulcis]